MGSEQSVGTVDSRPNFGIEFDAMEYGKDDVECVHKKRRSVADRKASKVRKSPKANVSVAVARAMSQDERDALRGYEMFYKLTPNSATIL